MKKKFGYDIVYIGVALATFPHSMWAFSRVIEGYPPLIDWATVSVVTPQDQITTFFLLLTVFNWYVKGFFMALSIDLFMFIISKDIQQSKSKNLFGKWIAFIVAASGSFLAQFYYAAHNGAPVSIAPGHIPVVVTGWLNVLLNQTVVIFPAILPASAVTLTLFLFNDRQEEYKVLGLKQGNVTLLTTKEAVAYAKTKYQKVVDPNDLRKIAREIPGAATKGDNNHWYWTTEQLEEVING